MFCYLSNVGMSFVKLPGMQYVPYFRSDFMFIVFLGGVIVSCYEA